MKIAVIGGGLCGVSIARSLALAGFKVDLLESKPEVLNAASRWNEGKLHLGYIFAKDKTLETARAMIEGSVSFFPILNHLFGAELPKLLSTPFIYDVMQSGQMTVEEVRAHFQSVDQIINSLPTEIVYGYPSPLSETSDLRRDSKRTSELVAHSFQTSEISLEIRPLIDYIRLQLEADSSIHIRCNTTVSSVTREGDSTFTLFGESGPIGNEYSHVVNASWEGRLHLDQSVGHQLPDSWSHRYKVAVHFRHLPDYLNIESATGMLGEYGDFVQFGNGSAYLSWYPSGRLMFSRSILPPPPATMDKQQTHDLFNQLVDGASQLWPQIESLRSFRENSEIRGGYIYTQGDTDINDPTSLLHSRSRFGFTCSDNYFSVDTGKLCTAPLVAQQVANHILKS